jgi:hypothetical protein
VTFIRMPRSAEDSVWGQHPPQSYVQRCTLLVGKKVPYICILENENEGMCTQIPTQLQR